MGRLKLYLGAAAGGGKTAAMLREGLRLRAEGLDVAVGIVETRGCGAAQAALAGLEVVPRRRTVYRGLSVEDLDLDRLLARRPRAALIDELAHTNVPGSRHARRYQDVEALLAAGIDVLATLNVHQVEEGRPGSRAKERVPARIVADADEVVALDGPAEDLRARLGGRRRAPSGSPSAAARRGAVLVCMSSLAVDPDRLVREGARIAAYLDAAHYVVYVETGRGDAGAIEPRVRDNIGIARRSGAKVVRLRGDDVVDTLIGFAREHGVSHLVAGRSHRSRWHELLHGSVIDRLIRAAVGIDVHVVTVEAPAPA